MPGLGRRDHGQVHEGCAFLVRAAAAAKGVPAACTLASLEGDHHWLVESPQHISGAAYTCS